MIFELAGWDCRKMEQEGTCYQTVLAKPDTPVVKTVMAAHQLKEIQ